MPIGGDYGADNVVLEDASINRSRGAAATTDAGMTQQWRYVSLMLSGISDRVVDVSDVVVADVTTAAEAGGGLRETARRPSSSSCSNCNRLPKQFG